MGKFAITKPVTITMFTIFYIALGVGMYMFLTRDLFPNLTKPALKIVTDYEGAASKDIEEQITKKLEEQLGAVKGLQNMRSYSGEEKSEIVLEFDFGVNLDFASIDIREKLDQVQADLPEDAKNPIIERFDPGAQPIIIASISTTNEDIWLGLRQQVEDTIKVQLERISGVASVHLSGGNLYEIRVEVEQEKLKEKKITLVDIEKALQRENVSIRGGRMAETRTEFLVRTVGSLKTVDDIKKTVIDLTRPQIRLEHVSTSIQMFPKRQDTLARLKTKALPAPIENIQISIYRKPGTNTIQIAEDIKNILKNYEKEQVQNKQPISMAVTYDQSVYIEASLENIKQSAIEGTILAIIILLIFLRNIESTVIISISMPISVVASFFLFPMVNMGLNLFSMAGITLAVGMVVDNAIVVIEAVFTNLVVEKRLDKSIIVSLVEIGPPVFSSTLTTLAVFIPILFVKGMMGQIFHDLSYTIIFALSFSLVVAFTFIPMLIFQFMGGSSLPGLSLLNKLIDKLMFIIFGWFGNLFVAVYKGLLRMVLLNWFTRLVLIVGVFVAFIISILILPPSELLPELPESNITIEVRLPAGKPLTFADMIAKRVEDILIKEPAVKDEIVQFTTFVSPKEIRFLIVLKQPSDEVMNELRKKMADVSGDIKDYKVTTVSPLKTVLAGEGGDIGIRISGTDLEILTAICEEVTRLLKTDKRVAPYLADVQNSMGEGIPELLVKVNKAKSSDQGISTEEVAKNVEMGISGKKVTSITMSENEGQVDIRVMAVEIREENNKQVVSGIRKDKLENMQVKKGVKLGAISEIREDRGPALIIRDERERIGIVSANIKKGKDSLALGEITNRLSNLEKDGVLDNMKYKVPDKNDPTKMIEKAIPSGYRVALIGTSEAMKESFKSLVFALIVALILVYMVMAGQFESLIHPFAIMFAMPLAMIGVSFGLLVWDINLSVTAYVGIILLAGVVVNNAIILVDYTNILRARGFDRNAAIEEAGITRLRPIFMSTLTTVLGMYPMALEKSLYQPLAVVVMFGLTFSTFLTLVFIPAIYCFFDDIKDLVDFIMFRISMIFK